MLERALAELPNFCDAVDPELRIRGVVRLLLESPDVPVATLPYDPATCPNCGKPGASDRSPYCGERCRAEAAFVRQTRSAISRGEILDPERQRGIGQALWNLQGGGFPLRQSMVPPRVIAKVIEREGSKCAVCGEPATEVDHTGSG